MVRALIPGLFLLTCLTNTASSASDGFSHHYVPEGLTLGAQIIFDVKISQHGSFAINLYKRDQGNEIAFHFNARPHGHVVRNSLLIGNGWGEEETTIPHFPFKRGAIVSIVYVVTPHAYVIFVNNRRYIEFKHRAPYQKVTVIRLQAAEYYNVTIQNGLGTPFTKEIENGLINGESVRVRGMVKDDAESFQVNFSDDRDGRNSALLFKAKPKEKAVTLDTTRSLQMKLTSLYERSKYFDAEFVLDGDTIQVFVNDDLFTSFKPKTPTASIKFVRVDGDIRLMDVTTKRPLPRSYTKKLSSSIEEGDVIATTGMFYKAGIRFDVDLMSGNYITMHINPRRPGQSIVINDLTRRGWGSQRESPLPDAMVKPYLFNMDLLRLGDTMQLNMNGVTLASYSPSMKISDVNSVRTEDGAFFYSVEHLKKLNNPYVNNLECSIKPGSWISVTGLPKENFKTFSINLETFHGDSVALSLSAFREDKVTVSRSFSEGQWTKEKKKKTDFPFKTRSRFQVDILVEVDSYRIFVNGKRHEDFGPHIIGPHSVRRIELSGECDFLEYRCF